MKRSSYSGFTLIELMVVVGILGVLAAIAIPAFAGYARRAKTAEVGQNLSSLFKCAAAYMAQEHSDQDILATTGTYCSVGDEPLSPTTPSTKKQRFQAGPNAFALGFTIADDVYFGYALTGTGRCGWDPNTSVYTFTAQGDLDGDSDRSTFELAAGTDESRTLYHARGIYIVNEVE